MNIWDILILLVIAGVVAYALLSRRRKPGGCRGDCGCCDACSACGEKAQNKKAE